MDRTKMAFAGAGLSLVGGLLNVLVSVIRLYDPSIWFLTATSGWITLFAAVFLLWDAHNRAIWGGIVFLYSNLGFVAFGLSNETQLLPYGFAALTLGVIGGALGIFLRQVEPSKTA